MVESYWEEIVFYSAKHTSFLKIWLSGDKIIFCNFKKMYDEVEGRRSEE